jgi:hypothetical protein
MLDNGMVEYTNIPITNNGRDEYGKFVKGNKINYGRIPSVTQREKQSMAMSGRPLSNEHKANLRGKKHSEEHKQKISSAQKGRISPMKGRKHTAESRAKMSKAQTLRALQAPLSEESRKKISDTLKGQPFTEERRKNISKSLQGNTLSEETKKKIADAHRGTKRSAESRKKMSESATGRIRSEETRTRMSIAKKKMFQEDADYVHKMAKAWSIKPNKPETLMLELLNDLYPGQWKYTGDFSFTINGKSPDFTNCNGKKRLIEVFGDYWHRGQNPQDRIDTFKPFGFETLVIWERELNDIDAVAEKIREFQEAA